MKYRLPENFWVGRRNFEQRFCSDGSASVTLLLSN